VKLIALLHRWAGGVVGLLLAVIGLSGTVLVWEESWIGLSGAHDPLRIDPARIGKIVAVAADEHPGLTRITFADEGMALHQAVYADGGGAYFTQAGQVVDRWADMWGRPELWLFDLHHYLFLGDTGKYVTGALGVLLFAFAVTGLVLWWRTRKTFNLRAWPARMTRSAIVRHHRDLGVIASPLLLMAAVTGSAMDFPALSAALLSPWANPAKAAPTPPVAARIDDARPDWRALMARGQAVFPDAAPRRLTLPTTPGKPAVLRLRQDFEWTPNGRTYVYLDPASAEVLAVDDPAARDTASAITEKFYPIHSAKVGGLPWHLALTFSGLALTLLGTFATWSFWFAGRARPATQRRAGEWAQLHGNGAVFAKHGGDQTGTGAL
jgi:uncharacterized iron-regulated membrane protein